MDGRRRSRKARDGRQRRLPRRAPESLEPRRLLTSGYLPLNLVSDQSGVALVQDGNLIDPWGLSVNSNGGNLWVAESGSGAASQYSGAVAGSPFQVSPLVVSIPGGGATGSAANASTSFVVHSGLSSGPASFMFASNGGNLSGWSSSVPPPSPSTQAQLAVSTADAVYTGLAIANNGGQNFLYAADFHDNRIDVFDAAFNSVASPGGFSDPGLPPGFAPYNIVNIGGQLLVSYALQDGEGQNAVAGAGEGFVDVFDLNGVLQKELIVGLADDFSSPLNAPWGMTLAPASFGDFGGDFLVANHGDGLINAFNPQTGAWLGSLSDPSGTPLEIDGLHGLSFGNGLSFGDSNELFFSAGTNDGADGLFGAIRSAQGAALAAQGAAFSATTNVSFSGALAVFSDAQNLPLSGFTATVDWGDGTIMPGVVSSLASGGFAVSGSHSYVASGTENITVQIRDSSGNTATASSLARVASQGLAMKGLTISPTEGAAFSGPVATFTDGDGNTSAATYSATIAWGDGASTLGTVSFNSGAFSVLGAHAYADEGTKAVSVVVMDLDGATASAAGAAVIADAPLTGFNRTISATETAAFTGAVATFTDANPNAAVGEFSATIDWGDGTAAPGVVSLGAGGLFSVSGTHTYGDEGSPTITVTVHDAGGSRATILSLANVADGDSLTATMLPIAATEGVLFSGAVASLTNSNALSPASGFSASIDWGDGATTFGTIVGAGGVFTVNGQHTYADEGPYVVRVNVADPGGTATASDQVTITAADSDAFTITGLAITPTEGLAFSGAVAAIKDAWPASADGLSTEIDWGDGTSDAGTLSGASGQFTLSGSHTYARFGTYLAVVSIADDAPGTAAATATLTTVVDDAPLTAAGVAAQTTEGQSFSDAVADFTDANPNGQLADFSATIDWGDGTIDAGTISNAGGFHVVGSHVYDLGGTYLASVTINDFGGASAAAACTMTVADYPLMATPLSVAGTEGSRFSGEVASFIDANPSGGRLADFTAAIDWGDGTVTAGTISGSAGDYRVSGDHIFSDETDLIVVTIDDRGGASTTVTVAASVADADVLTPTGMTLSATEGQAINGALATFADAYLDADADGFAAAVDWGDGLQSSATVTGSGGSFTVSGAHTYARPGTFTAFVSLTDDAPGTASATAASTIEVAAAPITASGAAISSTEGGSFTGTVASFIDGNTLTSAADFTATIDWGDGSPSSAGDITQTAAGGFRVTGSHVYADEGQNLPVTVVISENGGGRATATSTANVADAPLLASAVTISATEGATFAGAVATFTDANPNATAADFTATVDWGDGKPATSGTVTAAPGGGFVVSGSHAYAEEAAGLLLHVVIQDRGGSAATAVSRAEVADAPLAPGIVSITATEGITFSGVVATFTDGNPGAAATDFTATIDWGDGAPASAGTVSAAGGGFIVNGIHVYAEEATRNVTITIHDVGGSLATASGTARVVDAALTPGPALTIAASQGTLFSGTLGTFTDGNPNAARTDFSATIDWGDGASSIAGTIMTAPGGVFIISGAHTYTSPAAALPIVVTVNDAGGSRAAVLASAHVSSSHFTASGLTLATIEGTVFRGPVATCNDAVGSPAGFAATIHWGDGTTSLGTVASAAGGGFQVNAEHVFAAAGTTSFTVTITNPALDILTVTSRANVADAPLTAAGVTLSATVGVAFHGAVAAFTDADPGGIIANYTATIDWGDGATSTGAVSTGTSGGFVVVGSHIYAEETQGLAVGVTINDVGGARATASSLANVLGAPLHVTPAPLSVPPGGAVQNLVLATFTDEGGAEPLTAYAATIDWGDGAATAGAIELSAGVFQVTGSHRYAAPGTYTMSVSVSDEGGSAATAAAAVSVPPSANQLYIEAAYLDVLNRAVDAAGLAFWSQQLDAGQPRSAVVDSIDHSAEYFGNIIISPAYQRYLGRGPDASGLDYWIDQMQNHGLTDERLEAGFIGSAEFYAHAGGSDKGWVDAMYQDLLGRSPDASGEAHWLALLAGGANRADVAYGFAASREREAQRISDDYMHYLGRLPDEQGLDFWIAQFADGATNESVITGFVASDEYFKKHASG